MSYRLLNGIKFSPAAWVALILGALFLAASMAPIPYRFWVAPKGQVYDGTEFWSDDYSAYVSYITQGQRGKWLVYDTHTAEPGLPGILIHEEYLLWGKLTGVLGINPVYAYHLFRLILGALLIFVCWRLITAVFPDRPLFQFTAYCLLLFVGGFPHFLADGKPNLVFGSWRASVESYIPWLTDLDVFYRFVSLPHYLLGNIFFVLSIIQFIKLQSQRKLSIINYQLLILVTLGLTTGFFHAVSLVTLYATLAIYFLLITVIEFVFGPKKAFRRLPVYGLRFTVFVALTSPILIYFKYLLTLSPWSNLSAAWEATTYYYVPIKQLLSAIGPTIFLAPFGFILLITQKREAGEVIYEKIFSLDPAALRDRILKHRSVEGRLSSENFLSKLPSHSFRVPLLLFSWLIAFFLLFYFSHPFLHISQVRFFQTFVFIPASLLAAPVLVVSAEILSRLLFRIARIRLQFLLLLLLLLFTFSFTLPLAAQNFAGRFTFFSDFAYLAYPPKPWVKAIYWLRDNTKMDSVVLGAWQAGHHIPFMAGNYVYYGHMWGTLDINQKISLAAKFFKNGMDLATAEQFLKSNRIAYVFWGYEEKGYGGDIGRYAGLLSPVYSSPAVTIYKVR